MQAFRWFGLAVRAGLVAGALALLCSCGSGGVSGVETTRLAICWPLAIGALIGPS